MARAASAKNPQRQVSKASSLLTLSFIIANSTRVYTVEPLTRRDWRQTNLDQHIQIGKRFASRPIAINDPTISCRKEIDSAVEAVLTNALKKNAVLQSVVFARQRQPLLGPATIDGSNSLTASRAVELSVCQLTSLSETNRDATRNETI